MIIEHSLLQKKYNIDCVKYEIKKIIDLKSYLLNYLNGVTIENIKFIKDGNEIKNDEIITENLEKIYMAIIPITCCEHL
tara:strand:+ start:13174 stop:13410 length:237 start_codon:yes stop_codon:yes gene_type:complete